MERNEWLELRKPNINSTDAACLFGMCKYKSLFTLWHEKKGNIQEQFQEQERSIIGRHVEAGIASAYAEITGWENAPFKDYLSDSELRYGSSFDYEITSGPYKGWLLEIKNVDFLIFRDEWDYVSEQDAEAPGHIEIQVQHQLMVTKKTGCIILACVGGNTLKPIIRYRDDDMIKAIYDKISDFFRSIDDNKEPDPDYSLDIGALKQMYGNATENKYLNAGETDSIYLNAMIETYDKLSSDLKKTEAMKESIKMKAFEFLEDNSKATTDKYQLNCSKTKDSKGKKITITKEMVGEEIVLSKPRNGYRQFRFKRI